ncbi:hypothetical protein [Pandoraea oxalativorans]|uniref:Uncharacterized protein n=1 Tax=Pandoraea oxalativorans TaxID=573737 RepID=A0A0E3U4S2_9BURK|nr:hypothetical protein [Pandoraea oxalativorans]AKC68534.1 hypothetical protein MB84_02340 [Pandoraea oxalativorans]
MALDFDTLPPEVQVPDASPSRILWIGIFTVLLLVGIVAVLMLWPAGESTRTPWFWLCVAIYPAGIAMFFVSRVFSVSEGRRLDALAWNEACKKFTRDAFSRESVPLRILGAAFRSTEIDADNDVQRIANRTVTLDAKPSAHVEGTSVTARWLQPLDAHLALDEAERHKLVIEWLYDKLLSDLSSSLRAVPEKARLEVLLDVSGYIGTSDIVGLWQARWQQRGFREVAVKNAAGKLDLMTVDSWLDGQAGSPSFDHSVVLLVSVSLSKVVEQDPPHGTAESGVAILLTSPAMSDRHSMSSVASMHRPLRSESHDLRHALTYALKWGNASPTSLGGVWLTGLNGKSVGPLHAALSEIGASGGANDSLPEFDLDSTIGRAGRSAGWLAATCASLCVQTSGAPHLIAQRCGDQTFVAVVTTGDHE